MFYMFLILISVDTAVNLITFSALHLSDEAGNYIADYMIELSMAPPEL